MPYQKVEIPVSSGVSLIGLLNPSLSAANNLSYPSVLLLHPHPKFGGSMRNNVIWPLLNTLPEKGFTTLAIDTRGVGASTGSSTWRGTEERKDVVAAVQFLANYSSESASLSKVPVQDEGAGPSSGLKKVVILGYSFGSAIGFHVAEALQKQICTAFVAISLPCGFVSSLLLGHHYKDINPAIPKLFLLGTDDQFASVRNIEQIFDKLEQPKRLEIIHGADHFWGGREDWLVSYIVSWLLEVHQQ